MRRFIISLNKDIADNPEETKQFLAEFSEFVGVSADQLKKVYVRSGCTLIDGYGDKAGVERVHEYFKLINSAKPDHPELLAFKKFCDNNDVNNIVDDPKTENPTKRNNQKLKKLILIHGWGGSIETFGNLPIFLKRELNIPVEIYLYPTRERRESHSIAIMARTLDNWIRNKSPSYEVALLGHSLGGVLARYLAVIQECREKPISLRLVTLAASPTDGSLLAAMASRIPFIQNPQLSELSPNSGFLIDLNERWTWWRKRYSPDPCQVRTMYAMDDAVISCTSAIGSDPEAVPIFGVDHTSIVKPPQPDHEIVQTIARFCRDANMHTINDR